MVQILVHLYVFGKMIPVEAIPVMGEEGNKRDWQRG
jgi:hypothetical protein